MAGQEKRSSGKHINLNTASYDELASLPMIGRDKANDIISHRPFRSWEDVSKVPGFSRDVVDNLKNNVTI